MYFVGYKCRNMFICILEPASQGAAKSSKKRRVVVNLSSHQSWLCGDPEAPEFNQEKFELPKWALLKEKV